MLTLGSGMGLPVGTLAPEVTSRSGPRFPELLRTGLAFRLRETAPRELRSQCLAELASPAAFWTAPKSSAVPMLFCYLCSDFEGTLWGCELVLSLKKSVLSQNC